MSLRLWSRKASFFCMALLFGAFPMYVALGNSLMLLAVVFWLLGMGLGDWRLFLRQCWRNPLVRPALALVLLIVLATLWSPASWAEIGGYFKKYLKFLLLPVFIHLLLAPDTRRHCWQAFFLAMLFTLVSTWLNVWFDLPWSRSQNQGFGVDHTVFKDYISQGVMMSFFACASAHCAFRSASRGRALFWSVTALFAAVGVLVLLQGRTGYLSLISSAIVFALVALRGRFKSLLVTLSAVAALVVGAYAVSPQLQHRTQLVIEEARDSSLHSVTSVGARIEVWRFMMSNSTMRTLLGEGTASYPVMARAYFKDPEFCSAVCPHPHNQFLLFYFELGLLGLLLFFWFIGSIARQAFRHHGTHRALLLAFVVTLFISNMTHSSMWLSTESHFFILMSALLMASATQKRHVPPGAPQPLPGSQPS